ncbi:MAG: hypothetical protein AAF518_16800 [Spirochaetota bacterium]
MLIFVDFTEIAQGIYILDPSEVEKTRKIFILPFDIKAKDINNRYISPGFIRKCVPPKKSNKHFEDEIQKKRKRIFNSGLSQLIDKVTDKPHDLSVAESSSLESSQEEKNSSLPAPESILLPEEHLEGFNLFYKIYIEGKAEECLQQFLKHIAFQSDFEAFTLHYYNRTTACYHLLTSQGLDENSIFNYTFDIADKVLQKNDQLYSTIRFEEELKNDVFFSKKFTKQLLNRYTGLIIGFVKIGNLDTALSLFYDLNTKRTTEQITKLFTTFQKSAPLFYPALNRLITSIRPFQILKNDIVQRTLHFLQSYTLNGHRSCTISQIRLLLSSAKDADFSQLKANFMQSIVEKLQPGAKLLDLRRDKLLLLCEMSHKGDVIEIIESSLPENLDYQLQFFHYPEETRNLYQYL